MSERVPDSQELRSRRKSSSIAGAGMNKAEVTEYNYIDLLKGMQKVYSCTGSSDRKDRPRA